MKVICMDCQNESYADLESLKANRNFTCAQCAEKSRSYSENEVGADALLKLSKDIQLYSNPLEETTLKSEIPRQDEDILELSDEFIIGGQPDQAAEEQVILLPEIETPIPVSKAEPDSERIGSLFPREESPMFRRRGDRISPDVEGSHAMPEPGTDPSNNSQMPGILSAKEVEGIKRMRLMTFSTSKQLVVVFACVLSIILMQTLFARTGQVEVKAENAGKQSAQTIPPTEQKQVPAQVQTAQNSPALAPTPKPAATPAPAVVVAEKPAAVAAPSSSIAQPVEQPKGLYTVQIGAHQAEAEANDQAGKLRAAGFEARIVSAEIPNRGVWYRVQVGDFSSRDEANRFGATLRARGLADNFIISAL